jgi:hypothetical protein
MAADGNDLARTEATRYLCAGAELDEVFSDHIVSELFTQLKRAAAPSYGFDLVPIVKHCFRGRRRRALRDLALVAAILVEWGLFPLLTSALVVIAAIIRAVRRRRLWSLLGWTLVLLVLWAVAGHPMSGGTWVRPWGSIGNLGWWLISLAILLGLAVGLRYAEWHHAHQLVSEELRGEEFKSHVIEIPMWSWMHRRVDFISSSQYTNINLYLHHGDTRNFIGAGLLGRFWSFSVDLRPVSTPDDGTLAAPGFEAFRPSELHRHIENSLWQVRREEKDFAYGLPGLIISDRIVAPGWVREDDGLPPHLKYGDRERPASVPQKRVEEIIDGPEVTTRHYKCLRCEWNGGELSATVFLHLGMHGRTLYVEATPCLTSPIKGQYKNVDVFLLPRMEDMGEYAARCLAEAPSYLFGTFGRLNRAYWHPYRERVDAARLERRAISRRYVLDYGARNSVRDLASLHEVKGSLQLFDPENEALNPRRFHQLHGAEAYTKVLETQVIDAIQKFLDGRGIDTTEFCDRSRRVLKERLFAATLVGEARDWGQRPRGPEASSPYAEEPETPEP